MIIISANLPTVQLYLPGPLFTPLRIAKKGFLAIISETVQNIDLGPWPAQPNVPIAHILKWLLSSVSQKEAEISLFENLAYAGVWKRGEKGVKLWNFLDNFFLVLL